MYLTLDEALKQIDAPPDALMKGVKSGRLAGFMTTGGDWLIDAQDLLTKYKAMVRPNAEPVLRIVVEQLEPTFRVQILQEQLELERQRAADLRLERDRWAAQAEKMVSLMLPPAPARAAT